MVNGHAERLKRERRDQAWSLSHLLIAAGCEADKVTPAKLLGEKEPVDRAAVAARRKALKRMQEQKDAGPDPELMRLAREREGYTINIPVGEGRRG